MTFLELVRDKSTAPDPSTFLVHLESPFAGGGEVNINVIGIASASKNMVRVKPSPDARVQYQEARIKVQAIQIPNQQVSVT